MLLNDFVLCFYGMLFYFLTFTWIQTAFLQTNKKLIHPVEQFTFHLKCHENIKLLISVMILFWDRIDVENSLSQVENNTEPIYRETYIQTSLALNGKITFPSVG